MADSVIKKYAQIFVSEQNIANTTDVQTFSLPTGLNTSNCFLVGANCYTKYNSWVDRDYREGSYFGDVMFSADNNTEFLYYPAIAGNSTVIKFYWALV